MSQHSTNPFNDPSSARASQDTTDPFGDSNAASSIYSFDAASDDEDIRALLSGENTTTENSASQGSRSNKKSSLLQRLGVKGRTSVNTEVTVTGTSPNYSVTLSFPELEEDNKFTPAEKAALTTISVMVNKKDSTHWQRHQQYHGISQEASIRRGAMNLVNYYMKQIGLKKFKAETSQEA